MSRKSVVLPPFWGWWPGFLSFWGWGLALLLLISFPAAAQKVSATINRDKIRLGEQFDLKLKVEPTSDAPLVIDEWFSLPDTFANFQVVSRHPIDTIDIASTKSYSQTITLTSFDTGILRLPAFTVLLENKKELATKPLQVTVLGIDVSNKKDYNDIKDIIEPIPEQDHSLWYFIIVGIVLLVALYFSVRLIMNRKKNIKPFPVQDFTLEAALKKLDALEPRIHAHEYEVFFVELMAICRTFSNNQLHLYANNKTTSEYVALLKNSFLDKALVSQYIHLLNMVDKVKFSKAKPSPAECKKSLADAKSLLASIHSSHNKPTTNAV